MTNRRKRLIWALGWLAGCILMGSGNVQAQAQPPSPAPLAAPSEQQVPQSLDCQQVIVLLHQQQILITRETAQLKREIAALREDLSKPGFKEILAGIGTIFGLAGVGLYVSGRKQAVKR